MSAHIDKKLFVRLCIHWIVFKMWSFFPREELAGTEIPGGGGRGELYPSLHCHHQNDACMKMGSDESRFNVSFIVMDQVTRQCPQTTTFEEKGEPKRGNRTDICLLTNQKAAHVPYH